MAARSPVVLRTGFFVASVNDLECLPKVLAALAAQCSPAAPAEGQPAAPAGVLGAAQVAAGTALGALLQAFPEVDGEATSSFATLLRVRQVRDFLRTGEVRGRPLGKMLGYVAAASDAGRHLSVPLVKEAVDSLNSLLAQGGPGPETPHRAAALVPGSPGQSSASTCTSTPARSLGQATEQGPRQATAPGAQRKVCVSAPAKDDSHTIVEDANHDIYDPMMTYVLAPAKDDSHTIVEGANHDTYDPMVICVSSASCATCGSAPAVKAMHGAGGIQHEGDGDLLVSGGLQGALPHTRDTADAPFAEHGMEHTRTATGAFSTAERVQPHLKAGALAEHGLERFPSTGALMTTEKVQPHLKAGPGKDCVAAPAQDDLYTIVEGANQDTYDPVMIYDSRAPCAPSGLAPGVKAAHDAHGIQHEAHSSVQRARVERQLRLWRQTLSA